MPVLLKFSYILLRILANESALLSALIGSCDDYDTSAISPAAVSEKSHFSPKISTLRYAHQGHQGSLCTLIANIHSKYKKCRATNTQQIDHFSGVSYQIFRIIMVKIQCNNSHFKALVRAVGMQFFSGFPGSVLTLNCQLMAVVSGDFSATIGSGSGVSTRIFLPIYIGR